MQAAEILAGKGDCRSFVRQPFPRHLISSDISFLDRFKAIKEAYQIPDGLIDLELTESLMLERREIHLVTSMINRIREMGLSLLH